MPPNDSNSKALWLIVEGVLAAMILLCIGLLLEVRQANADHNDRIIVLEGRMDAGEADEFTSRDALEVWREISSLAKETAAINPAVAREFQHIERRVQTLESHVGKP